MLDFAPKGVEEYCLKEDNLLNWRTYVDDICQIGDNHNGIEIGLKAIQAGAAYIGLSFNVKKWEGMFLDFTNQIETKKEESKMGTRAISCKMGYPMMDNRKEIQESNDTK